jgi:Mn2+/Fe2+ NRAMP family transporter
MIMNGLKKGLLFTMMLAALSLALTGCFRSTTEVTPTPTPVPLVTGAVGATVMPGASLLPGQTLVPGGVAVPGAATTAGQPFDWPTKAATIENRINMFSEIQECSIVTAGNTALVGVVFTPQYKGEMTQRIRDMIAGEVMAADPSIQVVAVTSEAQDVATIQKLSQQQRSGANPEQLKTQVETIVRNATTLR